MSKKIISLILAAAMLLSLLAFQAFGAEADAVVNAAIEKDGTITEESEVKHIFTEKEKDELTKDEQALFRDAKGKRGTINMKGYVPAAFVYLRVSEPTVFHITIENTGSARVHAFAEKKWEECDSLFDVESHVLSFYVEKAMPVLISIPDADYVPSPTAEEKNDHKAAALPDGVCHVDADGKQVASVPGNNLVALRDAGMLTKDEQTALKNALEALPGAVSDDFSVRYFFFSQTAEPYNMQAAMKNAQEAKALKFVDGAWSEMESKLDTAAGTLTVMDMVDAPMAILAK